ncbi:MAG: hypothetical protein KF740_19385 [Ramlibacter sp.]|nr:hypothetical protein [Ramlibacter sp.]
MARKQLPLIAALAASAVAVALTAKRTGKNDIGFTAEVTSTVEGAPVVNMVCTDDGRVRTFKDADDFLKSAGVLGMLPESMDVTIDGLALVQPKPFTGDIIKRNAALVVSYGTRSLKAAERVTELTAKIALAAGDPAIPQAYVDELTAQKDAVEVLKAWLDAEIARINGILGAPD